MTDSVSKSLPFVLFITLLLCLLGCKKQTTGKTFFVIGQDTTIVNTNLVQFFTTTDLKLTDSIMIAKTASWDTGKVIFSIKIPELKQGDIIVVKGETQGMISINHNVAFNGYIILTDSPAKLPASGVPHHEITEDNGFNITPDISHGVMTKLGTYVCENDLTNVYINFCCKAYSSRANPPNDFLSIDQNFGKMGVVVYRN